MMTFLNGENFLVNHINCAFDELEVDFCKKVQFDEQIYLALCAIKQEVDEKVDGKLPLT
jgi:hypothetical protein